MDSLKSLGNDSYDGDVEDLSSEEDDEVLFLRYKGNQEGRPRKTKEDNTIEKKRVHVNSLRTNSTNKTNGKAKFLPSEENASSSGMNESLKSKVKIGRNENAKLCTIGASKITENETPDTYDTEGYPSTSHSSGSNSGVIEEGERHFIQNPTKDPRFQRLINQLVPNNASTKEAEKRTLGNEKRCRKQDNAVFFHDLCLKNTCRIIFKLMKIEI